MHDDPQFPGPGDSSSGIHRIIDPPPPDSEQSAADGDVPAAAEGPPQPGPSEPLAELPPASGEPVSDMPAVTKLTEGDAAFPAQVDPSAETVAEDRPPIPLPLLVPGHESEPPAGRQTPVRPTRSSLLLIGLISYASAATLALLYLLYAMSQGRPHALESLPDVPPLDVERGEVMKLAPADAELPPGHRLSLGESRRFGNVLVEPLRIAVEPVEFEHFSGRTSIAKAPTPPVLKLWLRFTNVSADQTIAPLDPNLVFRRAMLDHGPRANQFVRRVADESTDGPQVLLYDHPISSEWDLRDQQLGVQLAPGQSLETYLPSAEPGAELTGAVVWRIHFRKGYSPRGFGVTTLVDVEFDVPAPPATEPAAAG